MKGYLACLLIMFACITSSEAGGMDAGAYLDKAQALYRNQPEDVTEVVKLLSEGLTAHPGNIPLLQFRASLYCRRGKLPECRMDSRRLSELKPEQAEPRMMLCFLNELEGADQQACDVCYREVAGLYAATRASSPERETGNALNYVVALLMGRHPDAEKEKAAFLLKADAHPGAQFYHEILDNFDRERVLREVFGR